MEVGQLRNVADIGNDTEELAVFIEYGISSDKNLLLSPDGLVYGNALQLLHDEKCHGLVKVAFIHEILHLTADDLLGQNPGDPLVGFIDVKR